MFSAGPYLKRAIKLLGCALALILCAVPGALSSTDGAWVHCNLYASPSGSDSSGDGSPTSPFASVGKLDSALAPGQTGCLQAGSYGSTGSHIELDNDGSPGNQITLTSFPGENATVRGYVDIEGSYTTLSHLSIDGSNTFYTQVRSGTNCPAPVSQPL
ncbi:MAG TPA: hypothetical protein VH279_15360, partial [Solirubrobacteraceae bacterium]|nr:hypothetical protein [Solirubrobacteraceae bacterium]